MNFLQEPIIRKTPQDFRLPFSWQDSRCYLQDRLLFIPKSLNGSFPLPHWNDEQLFGNDFPVVVEYCSGNGSWIAEKAKLNPTQNFLAVEMDFDRARKIWLKSHNMNLSNLIVAWSEAFLLTKHFLKEASVDGIFINFPDPWPKRRHAKFRIIQPAFVYEMERILKKGSSLTIVTDDKDYSDRIIKEMCSQPRFQSVFDDPFYGPVPEDYGTSFFDALFRRQGKEIRFHKFIKRDV